MKQIISLAADPSEADDPRCDELASFLRRVAEAEEEAAATAAHGDAAAALLELAGAGRLAFECGEAVEVLYTPSQAAIGSVADDGGFPDAVAKKQAAALRRSQGAIFRFPAEEGEGVLEVFITDWSPCPVASAVAIHRDHPFAAGLEKRAGRSFTGRFVRHPLTGDLLPVWIADWVKPHFGTGAVLVNPAHDATDLGFAREVGLPLRFGLVPAAFDGSPATWPAPPIVRSGQAIKSGICDGLPADEAMARYFEIMAERGLAERTEDVQAGQWPLARLVPDAGGDLRWNVATRGLGGAGAGGDAVRVEPGALLEAALAVASGTSPSLVSPAAEQAGTLLFLRLLHFDLHGAPLSPAGVFVVQKSQGASPGDDAEVVRLSTLVGAPLDQVVSLKQKVTDQTKSFLKAHETLLESWRHGAPAAEPGSPPKSLRKARAAMLVGDPARAFGSVYALQKQLRKSSGGGRDATLAAYFAAVHVLAGLAPPEDLDWRKVWKDL